MEQVAFAPPPLPPKMRRAPPESTVQNNSGTADVFGYSFPEVQEGNSQVSSSQAGSHVVKIRINPEENASVTPSSAASVICEVNPCIRISVNTDEMISSNTMTDYVTERTNPYFYYGAFNCHVMSSGQVSPSDTLDSGTCSDLDSTPPPLPKKKSAGVTVTLIGGQNKKMTGFGGGSGVEGDSDDDSNLSCDSLNSGELQGETNRVEQKLLIKQNNNNKASSFLPQGLLKDIRNRSVKLTQQLPPKIDNEDEAIIEKLNSELNKVVVDESSYHHRQQKERQEKDAAILSTLFYDTDKFYDFHLNEHLSENDEHVKPRKKIDDEYFAGYKDFMGCEDSKTIRSAKGTVRGVKNRVRAGIATFLQINSATRNYKEKDSGKVVVYTTTMGIVRETYHACMKVKQILRTLLVKYEERDVFMSGEYQAEIRERMRCDHILVPQVFVDGQHVGDVETIERLNETGELRRLLKPYKSMDVCTTCQTCGGYRLLPCPVCNGSKKSVHRNHFTTEFVALKCMNCDEVGLVKCSAC